MPHLVEKIKCFPLKVKSFRNAETHRKLRGGVSSTLPCPTVGVWICVYVRGLSRICAHNINIIEKKVKYIMSSANKEREKKKIFLFGHFILFCEFRKYQEKFFESVRLRALHIVLDYSKLKPYRPDTVFLFKVLIRFSRKVPEDLLS